MKNGFAAVFIAELKNAFTSPRIFVILLLPIVLFTFYGTLYIKGVANDLPIAVLDQDHSTFSRELIRSIDATSTINILQYVGDEQEAQNLLRTQKVYGFMIIPDNFQRDIFRGKVVNAMFYENNNFLTPAGVLSKAFLSAAGSFSASIRVSTLLKQGQSLSQAGVSIQPIKLDSHVLFNPYTNYRYYLCLTLLPMSLQLIVMLTTVYIFGKMLKRREGQALYQLSGENVWSAYWGKILPYTLIFSIIAVYMINYMFWYLEIPLNGTYLSVLLPTLALVVVYQLMGLFFVSISKEFRSLATIAGGYSSLAFSFVGYTFPAEGMPKAIQIMDYIFPLTSYARMYINIAMRGNPIKYSISFFTGLLVFATIGLLSLPKFSKVLQKGGYDDQKLD